MKVIRYEPSMVPLAPSAVAVGMYDGVHLGHLAILELLNQQATPQQLLRVVLTFDPHPRAVLGTGPAPQLLTLLDERLAKLRRLHACDVAVVVLFTPAFAQLSHEQFVEDILVKRLNMKEIIVGYDHRFGAGRGGGLAELQTLAPRLGYHVTEVPARLIDNLQVSSSRIREALLAGEVTAAANLLGDYFMLNGTVVHGDQIGRTLGWPTANLRIAPEKLIPGHGVYACWATGPGGTRYKAAVNIGTRPTVGGRELRVEAYLLNFSGDLYGQPLQLEFVARLRPDQHFASLPELTAAIAQDVAHTAAVLGE